MHVKEPGLLRLCIVDGDSRRGSLPQQTTAVLQHLVCRGCGRHAITLNIDTAVLHRHRLGVYPGVELGVSYQQPTILRQLDGADIVAGQLAGGRVHRDAETSRELTDALQTASQHAHPDVAPLVFAQRPYVVVGEVGGLSGGLIDREASVLHTHQTPSVGTEPQRTVAGSQAAHDDIRAQSAVLFIV